MAGDHRLILPVAGASDLVAGRLEDLDHPVVEVPLRREGDPDRVDGRLSHDFGSSSRRASSPDRPSTPVRLAASPDGSSFMRYVSAFSRPITRTLDAPSARARSTSPRPCQLASRIARSPRDRSKLTATAASFTSEGDAGTTRKLDSLTFGLDPTPLRGQDRVKPLQPEGETSPSVVAVAAEDPGEAVITAAAADLDRPFGRRGDHLEDHLRVKPDPPAETEIQLDAIKRDAVIVEIARTSARSEATESGASPSKSAGQPVEHGRGLAFQVGEGSGLVANPVERLEPGVPQVPLPAEPMDDLVAGPPAVDDRDEGPEQAVDPAVVAPVDRQREVVRPRRLAKPLGEVVEPPAERADVPPFGGGLAEHLHQSRLRRRWQAGAAEHLQRQADVAEAERRPFHARGFERGPGEGRSPRRRRRRPSRPAARRRPGGIRGAGRSLAGFS